MHARGGLGTAVRALFARWGASGAGPWLEREIRTDLKRRGARAGDGFRELVARAGHLEVDGSIADLGGVLPAAVERLSLRVRASREELARGFLSGGIAGSTPVAAGTALPHARLPRIRKPMLLLGRSLAGVEAGMGPDRARRVHAMFFLVGPREEPARHLRLLAELAARADDPAFLPRYLQAEGPAGLRRVLLDTERRLPARPVRRPVRGESARD